MGLRELTLRNDADAFTYRVDLDNRTYVLLIAWNVRDERWYIYIADSENREIASSPLLINTDLWRRFRNSALPQGIMLLIDPAGDSRECERFELGTRCKLLYQEAADVS